MPGSVYTVVFSDGTIKAGFTAGGQYKRIKAHAMAAKSFGLTLDMVFFSEMHLGAKGTEKKLLAWLGERLPKRSPEHFSGGSVEIAREAMLSTGKLVAWADTVETVGGKFLVSQGLDAGKKSSGIGAVEERILALIVASGPAGITEGIIKNRFRSKPVLSLLDDMLLKGSISEREHRHPNNGRKIRIFFL